MLPPAAGGVFFAKSSMSTEKDKPVVISVGGSLIIPNGGIDTQFLSKLNRLIRKHIKQGRRFLLVSGGGAVARHYIEGGKGVIGNITEEDLDWLGIHATRLNAQLLRTIFIDIAHSRIIENYNKKLVNWREPVAIGSGWKPGWSTDYCAAVLARDHKASLFINLSDIDWVYDKDPNVYKDAKIIKKTTWEQMEKLFGTKWTPGFKSPFDPIAVQLAKKLGITVVITNGHDFENLEKILSGGTFKGTVIAPLT